MTAVSSQWYVRYGSVLTGTFLGKAMLHGPVLTERSYESLSVEFSAVISEPTDANFRLRCSEYEAEFRKPRLDLDLRITSTEDAFTQAANTGMNAVATIRRVPGSRFDSELSREYRCRVEVQLPADAAEDADGEAGLRVASIRVTELPTEQRVVEISGTYTAQPGDTPKSATEQYEAEVDNYAETVLLGVDPSLTDIAASWDLQPETYQREWKNKVLNWSRTYIERIFDESNDNANEAGLRNVRQIVIPRIITPVGAEGLNVGRQPIPVIVVYSCDVVRSTYPDLNTAWTNVIRPRIKRLAELAVGADEGAAKFTTYAPDFDRTAHRLSVEAELVVYGTSRLLAAQITTKTSQRPGFVLIPAHDDNPHARVPVPAPAQALRTRKINVLVRGPQSTAETFVRQAWPDFDQMFTAASVGTPPGGAQEATYDLGGLPGIGAAGGGWVLVDQEDDVQVERMRGETETGDSPIQLTTYSLIQLHAYAAPASTSGGGSASPAGGSAGGFSTVERRGAVP